MTPPSVGPVRATLTGLCASLVGIGLARFAYTPLIPALIAAGWFTPAQAGYLGATNFAGYLAGALGARVAARRMPPFRLLRAMMLLASVAFFACASPASVPWFFAWRFLAGLAGGVLMVLAAPTILPLVPARRRGIAGGAIFTGVGLGIAASGILIPRVLPAGLPAVWIGLGVLSLALSAVAWGGWPRTVVPPAPAGEPASAGVGVALAALIATYGLNAVGLVPHMVFLVDFVARWLGEGLAAGAAVWVAFGLGALLGPALTGALADRIGFVAAFRLALMVQAAMVAVPLLSTGTPALWISGCIAGAFAPGIVPLALGRIYLLRPPGSERARAAWGWMTAAWALGQALGAYGLSFVFSITGSYAELFAVGCAALVLALLVDLFLGQPPAHKVA